MAMMLPVGIQSFSDLRNSQCYYADKTALIHRLLTEGKYYFLGRPRRFGKSLTVSTLKEYFLGHKELFSGLALASLAEEWTPRPVFHLDFASLQGNAVEALDARLSKCLTAWERQYGVQPLAGEFFSDRFEAVIEAAHHRSGQQVAILIDEYDKPLLSFLNKPQLFADQREKLQSFYSVVKSCADHIRFAFITGVTHFSKLNVFSGLNNLSDISMSRKYATLCGLTERELRHTFARPVRQMAEERGLTEQQCYDNLKSNYDGYQFAPGAEPVYNPFSLCKALADGEFGDYWELTGLPAFLAAALRDSDAHYDLSTDLTAPVNLTDLAQVDVYKRNPIPLLFQTGYLTLDKYDDAAKTCTLRIPNREVRRGFLTLLAGCYLSPSGLAGKGFKYSSPIAEAALTGNARRMMLLIKQLMDAHPFVLKRKRTFERDFQNCIYIIAQMLGLCCQVEMATCRGRIDASIMTDRHVFVLEFKLDSTAQEALQQIDDNGYTAPFRPSGKHIFAIGVAFSKLSRSIDHYLVRHPDGRVTSDRDDESAPHI